MVWHYSNTSAETTLTSPISAVDTSLTVASVSGFPVSFPYSLILELNESSREVVTVTAAAANVLTVTRGQDGTSAGNHASGSRAVHGIVARDLSEPQAHIAATTGVHGIGGSAVVGTAATQTLTNKTIDGIANTLSNIDTASLVGTISGASIVGTISTSLLTGNINASTVVGTHSTLVSAPANGATGLTVSGTGSRTVHLVDISDAATGKGLIFGDDGTVTVDDGDLVVDTRRAPGAGATVARVYSKSGTAKPALILDRASGNTANLQEWRGNGSTLSSVDSAGRITVPTITVNAFDVSGAWTTWTPTLTNLTLGSGSVAAAYWRIGQIVNFRFKFIFGSGSAVGTGPRFTLPVAPHASYSASVDPFGSGTLGDSGTNSYLALVRLSSGSTLEVVGIGVGGVHTAVTATAPFTWASGDSISISGRYEAA